MIHRSEDINEIGISHINLICCLMHSIIEMVSFLALGDKATENEEKAVEEAVVSSETGHKESLLPLVSISRILKGIPQTPHFLALKRYSELARKNLIGGWDRLFEETIDQIQALRVEELWGRAAELWRTLQELQSMGYNVILLRRRFCNCHCFLTKSLIILGSLTDPMPYSLDRVAKKDGLGSIKVFGIKLVGPTGLEFGKDLVF